MKFYAVLICMAGLLAGCAGLTPGVPTAAVPQSTGFPTLPLPTGTQAPTSAPLSLVPTAQVTAMAAMTSPVRTQVPRTQTRLAEATTSSPQLVAPAVVARFELNPLVGEGRSPVALALLGQDLYVANRVTSNLGIVTDGQVRSFLSLDASPTALAADLVRNRIYASSYATPTIYLIENQKVIKEVSVDGRVNALALDGDILYVGLDNDAIIERYDATTLEKKDELKLAQGYGISALVLDKPRNRLYAGEFGRIVGVDLASFQELNSFGVPYLYSEFAVDSADGSVWSGAYDAEASKAYVVGFTTDGREIGRYVWGQDLNVVAVDGEGRVFVLDRILNQVHVMDTHGGEILESINVNEAPSDAVIDFEKRVMYVASQDNDTLSVIDMGTLQVTGTIPLANNITALAASSSGKRVFAVNSSTNEIYAIVGNAIVARAKTGISPVDIAVDEIAHRLYVANRGDGTIKVMDEHSLELFASFYVMDGLATVAVDAEHRKIFAGGVQVNPDMLSEHTPFYATGLTIDSQTTPRFERANPNVSKLYALASNGVPGSNSRLTLYRFDYEDMANSEMLGSRNGGNTTALDIETTTNYVFAANTHPLAYTHGLDVFDASDTIVQSIPLASHTTALTVNPATHHVFLAHAQTYAPYPRNPAPRDNTIEILDSRTLGVVGTLDVPNDPWRMTLLDGKIYVADYKTGGITVIQDAETTQAPAPTPTLTPSPYPTLPPTDVPAATLPAPTATPTAQAANCDDTIPIKYAPFVAKVAAVGAARLGCATAVDAVSEGFAYQPLERGFMVDDYRDANAKKVYVFFPDGTYKTYPDTFADGADDRICLDVNVPAGMWRPKRGFGTVWCNFAEVQALGAGLVEEGNVTPTIQPFRNGTLWEIPERGVIVLWNDRTWE